MRRRDRTARPLRVEHYSSAVNTAKLGTDLIYLHEIAEGPPLGSNPRWGSFCNGERPHEALDGRTPAEVYRSETPVDMMDQPLRASPSSLQAWQQQQEEPFNGLLAK